MIFFTPSSSKHEMNYIDYVRTHLWMMVSIFAPVISYRYELSSSIRITGWKQWDLWWNNHRCEDWFTHKNQIFFLWMQNNRQKADGQWGFVAFLSKSKFPEGFMTVDRTNFPDTAVLLKNVFYNLQRNYGLTLKDLPL